jgi:hypothetical protein
MAHKTSSGRGVPLDIYSPQQCRSLGGYGVQSHPAIGQPLGMVLLEMNYNYVRSMFACSASTKKLCRGGCEYICTNVFITANARGQ